MVDLVGGNREKDLGFNSMLTSVPLFQPNSALQPLALCGFDGWLCFKASSAKWLDSHSQPLLWHLICLLFPVICDSMVHLLNLTAVPCLLFPPITSLFLHPLAYIIVSAVESLRV